MVIRKRSLGVEHQEVAESLNNLATLYHLQGKYDKAYPLYKKSLYILENILGKNHPNIKQVKKKL